MADLETLSIRIDTSEVLKSLEGWQEVIDAARDAVDAYRKPDTRGDIWGPMQRLARALDALPPPEEPTHG